MKPAPPFETPDACEAAFYRAFREGDLQSMEDLWSADRSIICIHPGRAPLAGPPAVLQSWREILGATGGVHVRFDCQDRTTAGSLAVHMGLEIIGEEDDQAALVTVTNIYELTRSGWKMKAHHAAPVHRAATGSRRPLH
ncbi:MAG: nuclear transport factor 2 family protein [Gammaproteobacteria bacterium]